MIVHLLEIVVRIVVPFYQGKTAILERNHIPSHIPYGFHHPGAPFYKSLAFLPIGYLEPHDLLACHRVEQELLVLRIISDRINDTRFHIDIGADSVKMEIVHKIAFIADSDPRAHEMNLVLLIIIHRYQP